MIIDAHIHLWDRLHGDDLGIDRQPLGWGLAREGDRIFYAAPPSFEDTRSTYQRALAQFACDGVSRAVVLQEFMDGKQDDYLAEVRRLHPDRFCCMALFDRHYYDDPMGRFKRAIDGLGLQGFLVKTPSPFAEVATPALMPIWRECAARGLPVVLKNGAPEEARRLLEGAPGLKVVFSHFAGVAGPRDEYEGRLALVADYEHATIDMGGFTFRHRYPFPRCQELLQEAVERVGANKIAWGSDYPRPGLVVDASYRQQIEFITVECTFLSDAQRAEILCGTALRVYPWG